MNIEFSRKGLRKNEGIDVYIDEPELFKKGYSMHKNELAYSDFQMSSAFSIPVDVIKRFCDNNKNRSKLRVLI